jgi:hypothetical protein
LTDPGSKTTYFQAATMLSQAAAAKTDVNSIKPIPFWENIFPGMASAGGALANDSLNCEFVRPMMRQGLHGSVPVQASVALRPAAARARHCLNESMPQ